MTSPLAMALLQAPQPKPPTPTNVDKTDVSQIYQNSYTDQMAAYNAKVAQRSAMYGGLAGIGGAGMNLAGGLFRGQGMQLLGAMGMGPNAVGASSAAMPAAAAGDVVGDAGAAAAAGGAAEGGFDLAALLPLLALA